jgi:hypothetical protein
MVAPPNKSTGGGGGGGGLEDFGQVTAVAGALLSSIGAFYGVQSQRYQLRSRSLSLLFQASTAGLNAQVAEIDAAAILEAGKFEKGLSTLRFGQIKATSATQQAAAGVQAGVGSAGEVQASIELAKDIDSLTIERNAVRAAGAARLRAVNFRNQAALARVSAANVRRFSSTLSPGLAGLTSLIGGSSQVASSFLAGQGRS